MGPGYIDQRGAGLHGKGTLFSQQSTTASLCFLTISLLCSASSKLQENLAGIKSLACISKADVDSAGVQTWAFGGFGFGVFSFFFF